MIQVNFSGDKVLRAALKQLFARENLVFALFFGIRAPDDQTA